MTSAAPAFSATVNAADANCSAPAPAPSDPPWSRTTPLRLIPSNWLNPPTAMIFASHGCNVIALMKLFAPLPKVMPKSKLPSGFTRAMRFSTTPP